MFSEPVQRKKHLGINLTPLIDVLFLLLIFFMVSSTFRENQAIDVTLPSAATAELKESDETIVTIDRNGTIYIDSEEIAYDELNRELTGVFMKKGETNLIMRADENVPYKVVVYVMDTARSIGFRSIAALTEKNSE
ncbi:biopolymer transporter ExbD [bacterium]|nr:biopolymer transporter ExbD [bacterium]MCP5461563.1 biopolymer transporter ExbD [bacterium]